MLGEELKMYGLLLWQVHEFWMDDSCCCWFVGLSADDLLLLIKADFLIWNANLVALVLVEAGGALLLELKAVVICYLWNVENRLVCCCHSWRCSAFVIAFAALCRVMGHRPSARDVSRDYYAGALMERFGVVGCW
ncbi:hypothetical protein Nepgr_007902 [Nepenthes gracilis]|uniref:Uncharacterized protein n=1 Tax=Nepenthes gracilis TaxID=150966 RepID=A0AAD3S8L4_NEPGR|nr:hypothetical protein Nepgr_007902 [Nepenthes gracilis]